MFDYLSANITCIFSANAPVLGCHVFFGSLFEVRISKDQGSTDPEVARASVTFPEEVNDSTVVTVAAIMPDGSVGLATVTATVNIFITETGEAIKYSVYS